MEENASEKNAPTDELTNEQYLDDSAVELNLGLDCDSDIGESKDISQENLNGHSPENNSRNGNSMQDSESSEEEGQLSPVKDNELKKIYHQKDKDKDDGELSDDDIEEGEVKDTYPASNQQTRRICHFFNRGNCTWGNQCRFLHLSVKERGFYDMFSQSRNSGFPCTSYPNRMTPRTAPPIRYIPQYNNSIDPENYSSQPGDKVAMPNETVWDRGLQYAKEVIKVSKERKQEEICYEEKKLRLNFNELEEHDKENYCRSSSPYSRGRDELICEVYRPQNDYRNKHQYPDSRIIEQKAYSREWKRRGSQRAEIQNEKRDEEWRDPWRRSKSPKDGKQRSSSHSSVSSHSSYTGTSHSSYQESNSSSRSSSRNNNYQDQKKVLHRSMSRQRSLTYRSRSSSEQSTATRSRSRSIDRLSLSSISSSNSSHKSEPPDDYSSRKVSSTQKPRRSYQPPMTRTLYEEMQRLQRRKLKEEKRNSSPDSTKGRKTNKRAFSPGTELDDEDDNNKSDRLKDISSRRAKLVKQLKVLDAAISKKRAKH